MGQLKAFITSKDDEYRLPYGTTSMKHPRRTSFCGTVNHSRFLNDSENRRWWIVCLKDIDLDKLQNIDMKQLWGEVYNMWINDPQGFRLTKAEQAKLQNSNRLHQNVSNEEVLLQDLFNWSVPFSEWEDWYTTTEIYTYISQFSNKAGQRKIADALHRINIEYNNGKLYKKFGRKYLMPPKYTNPSFDFEKPVS